MVETKIRKNNFYRYKIILLISLIIFAIELVGGILSHSLALFSDAWHVFCDKIAIVLTIIAEYLAEKYDQFKEKIEKTTFLANSFLFLFVAFGIFKEALFRIYYPQKIVTFALIVIATIGAIGNFIQQLILKKMSEGLKEVRKVLSFHILSDLWQSLAIVLNGIVIILTNWLIIDTILSLVIVIIMFCWGIKLLDKFVRL